MSDLQSTPNFSSSLRNVIDICLRSGLKNVLVGGGLMVGSFTIVLSVLNFFLVKFVSLFDYIDPDYLNLVGILGFDKAISTVISAYIIRLTILTFKVNLIRGSI